MGVIDLDARVKKLEQDATGGAVIDQLEAAVTALDETVNGNGTTDFGLVGDVSALKTAAIPVKTAVTELTNGTAYTDCGGVFYETLGNLVHVHVAVSGLTANTQTTIFTLPEAVRPSSAAFGVGASFQYFADAITLVKGLVSNVNGNVLIYSAGTYAIVDMYYFIGYETE